MIHDPCSMIILGIDPGIARVGYAVLLSRGERIVSYAFGCLETDRTHPHQVRLAEIHGGVRALIRKYKPTAVALERLFFQTNAKTALTVGEGRGVILLAAALAALPVIHVSPQEVKLAVTGYGKADKRQVQEMVRRTLNLRSLPKPDDAADALAIAIAGIRYAGPQIKSGQS